MELQAGGFRRTSPPQQPNCLLEAARATGSKSGSYGVSIRVQGIDGHPYIVLNNAERSLAENGLGPGNGQQVTREMPKRSSDASEPEKKLGEDGCLEGTNHVPPGVFKTSKQFSVDAGEHSVSHFKTWFPKTPSLLNFQRHPELLQPYDPEKNVLTLESFQSPLLTKPQSLPGEEERDSRPWSSPLKVRPLETPQIAELFQSKPKTVNLTKSVAEEDLSKQEVEGHRVITSPSERPESSSPSEGSPYDISPPACQEGRRCRPDLLPFRRQDSAGSVLNSSRRSSSSSATPTSVASLYKFFLDDQEYAIYADNVNRHENRRYIPFLPGTGRDIDTGAIPPVDQLIEKFDRKPFGPQRRGRLGFRSRIHPDDRKRSRSVDSALSGSLKANAGSLDEFSRSRGTSSECLSQPSKVCLQKLLSPDQKSAAVGEQTAPRAGGTLQAAAARDASGGQFNSLQYDKRSKVSEQSLTGKSSTLPIQNKKSENKTVTSTLLLPNRMLTQKLTVKTFAAASNAQVTPDLLRGQQELAQQTNEETAKQILYNYLKEGGSENDDAMKRKVNLVFEKIQTLKSRAAGSTQVSDPSAEVKALMEQKQQLEKLVLELQRKLDLEVKDQQTFKAERDVARAELRNLQQQLEESLAEKEAFWRRLEESEKDLRLHLEELFQVKMEREQHQTEIRDLQEQLSEMHDELDSAKHAEDSERRLLLEELMQLKRDLQAILAAREQQEEVLRKRERELTALKGALKEEVSSHDLEVDRLKEQHGQALCLLQERLEAMAESVEMLSSAKAVAEQMQSKAEGQLAEMVEQNQQLKETLAELEKQRTELQQDLAELKEEGGKMAERVNHGEKEKRDLEEEVQRLAAAKASLKAQLAEAQKDVGRLNQEQKQLSDQLKDEATQKDQLKRMKSDLERERWQLDKTIEKLHKEMAEIVEVSRASTLELQNQLDEYKEKNRRELAETQRQLKEKNTELEKAHLTALKMQEEVRYLEEELRDHQRAQDEAVTKTQLLEQTVKALEYELEAKNHLKEDRARQSKIMEDKMAQLELELEEERSNSEVLSERIRMCREQMEQMRSDLLQERTVRQDLECDKISLERQNKDLKSRILHLEGSYRSSKEVLLVQMEARILELEEKLESEERDRGNLQLSNRRLERKVKELLMQVDDEHLSLTDQKDQLSLRLKAMKRQVEEAEEEIDRLESSKKKLQRELEEQVDVNDQLQGQLSAIKKELSRHKKVPSKMLSELDDEDDEDDDFSTDGESLYEAPSGFKFLKDEDIKS